MVLAGCVGGALMWLLVVASTGWLMLSTLATSTIPLQGLSFYILTINTREKEVK